ncbi:MAG TPA: lipid-binding SYLF domain-containing protein [Acidobacteriaceae bacterium]|nr:lipid-binding SYLF domain-containing protein [Acidobacteriaceae bacterium]
MKKFLGALCGFAMLAGLIPARAADMHKMDGRLNAAADVIQEIMSTPDRGIPEGIVEKARCVVVVPHYKKGAFVIGAEYGQGVATCRTGHGWSAPVFVKLEGGSFGWQIGGQSTDLVLIAMNQNGLESALKSKVKLGADASAAAGPVGRNAEASTDIVMNAQFLTYSRAKGLFAGLDLSGTALSENHDDMDAEYGNGDFEAILHHDTAVPPNAQHFVSTVARYFVVAREH